MIDSRSRIIFVENLFLEKGVLQLSLNSERMFGATGFEREPDMDKLFQGYVRKVRSFNETIKPVIMRQKDEKTESHISR